VFKIVSISCIRNYSPTGIIFKMAVFRDAAPSSLIEIYQCFGGSYSLHHQGDHRPNDGGKIASET
jgi:hypothetical protein